MNTLNNNILNNNSLEYYIDELNSVLFTKELKDIYELTYAYTDLGNDIYVNKTLFGYFLDPNFKDSKDSSIYISENIDEIFNKTYQKISDKLDITSYYISFFESKFLDDPKINILIGYLKYIKNIFNLVLGGLIFEREKSGKRLNFTQDELECKVSKIEEIEKELFGGNIGEGQFNYEINGIYNNFESLLTKDSNKYSFLKQYISFIKNNFTDLQLEEDFLEQNTLYNDIILQKSIKREDYIKIFSLVFEIYNIDKPIIVDERSSIYDGEDALYIPSSDSYKTQSIKRILELISHEIETHYIIEKNNGEFLGNFRGANNLEREEGLAMVTEGILSGKQLTDFKVSGSIIDIFIGEKFSGSEYLEFLSKYLSKNAKTTFLRRKRNYPINYRGVQHKDTSYNRGVHKIIDYINSGKNIKDLYIGKVSFEDIEEIKKLSKDKKIIYPILLGEMLRYILEGNKLKFDDFFKYISLKYPFFDFYEEFYSGKIINIETKTKRKIIQILEILK